MAIKVIKVCISVQFVPRPPDYQGGGIAPSTKVLQDLSLGFTTLANALSVLQRLFKLAYFANGKLTKSRTQKKLEQVYIVGRKLFLY